MLLSGENVIYVRAEPVVANENARTPADALA
jgi:hypothetical protein